MSEKELNLLKQKPNLITDYNSGIEALYRSGVFTFLRSIGRVYRTSKDTVEVSALDGAYAAGFQDCLDVLLNFREKFIDPKPISPSMTPDYGGARLAYERGDITLEEYNGIRNKPTLVK